MSNSGEPSLRVICVVCSQLTPRAKAAPPSPNLTFSASSVPTWSLRKALHTMRVLLLLLLASTAFAAAPKASNAPQACRRHCYGHTLTQHVRCPHLCRRKLRALLVGLVRRLARQLAA